MVCAVLTTAAMAAALSAGSRSLPLGTLLMLPILVGAYFGRMLPGLAATVTAVLALVLLPNPTAPLPWLRPLGLLIVGGGMTIAIEALHRARTAIEVEKRTAVESNARFSRVFHSSPMAMCLSRLDDGVVVEINGAYTDLFGLRASQVIGHTPQAAGLRFDVGSRDQLFAKMRLRGWIRDEEIRVETPSGERAISVSSQVVDLGGVKHSIATFVDLTERRSAEIAAADSQQRFRELAENVEEVFWVCDAATYRVEYMSPAYERMFHRPISALERDPFDWIADIHPDDRARIRALFDGIDVRRDVTFRVVLPDATRTLKAAYLPIRRPDGQIVRIAGITSDITAQLALEEQVRQSQKLESLGLLAGGVAHDFNNILAVIGSSVGMLEGSVPASDMELVEEIESAVKRGASLTRQLLAFSRRQVIAPVVLDINQVVEETRKMLRRMVGDDVTLSCSLDPELYPVMLDAGALVQVLMNLAVNARDAMPRGGSLRMTTRNLGTDDVLLEVTDTGCGIPPELVTRIFEPFFTTKGVGKGTGLGLSVVHGIVQQAGGRIEVRSQVGAGTTFTVVFPRSPATKSALVHEPENDEHGDEKILLVDDDAYVRTSAARALRAKGYTVLEAADGETALALFERHAESIALLVTDVVMPGMDGRQLVVNIRERRPALRVLYTSGYTDDAVVLHGVQHDKVPFLEKPFRARQLAGSVRRTLDVGSGR